MVYDGFQAVERGIDRCMEIRSVENSEILRISCEEVNQLIVNVEDAVLIDIRSHSSYEAGHLKGAVNIYYNPTGSPFDREITLSALPVDKLLIIYCD